MFSIAAINDTDSAGQWEPLAPSKEAQEFHLSQIYHDGLLKLHSKEYEKACELLESVLKDPLISNAQGNSTASDSHLLQLRFLALKNLATAFLQQGSAHYEKALQCYLEAVEIDAKDSVVWNKLGILSCSMGLLGISRWAFEQGLLCSPNNWNCMEKLLEILIAIGDEVACLSLAELILRHWPSHARALHVKSTIEESETVPFAPRGIDKLQPKHARLKFPEKRIADVEISENAFPPKRLNRKLELSLKEASWSALVDALLEMLVPLGGQASDPTKNYIRSGDVCLTFKLPSISDTSSQTQETRGLNGRKRGEYSLDNDSTVEAASTSTDKAMSLFEEQPHERRSSRLESLRNRKPGKEESDLTTSKNLNEVIDLLEPFMADGLQGKESDKVGCCLMGCQRADVKELGYNDIHTFIKESTENYGAYHVAHLVLQTFAARNMPCRDLRAKLLELDKLTRNWGQDKTLECHLFLSELYYDVGLSSSETAQLSDYMSEASFHLCKIIEKVALEYSCDSFCAAEGKDIIMLSANQDSSGLPAEGATSDASLSRNILLENKSFGIRYFWLRGRLSLLEGNKLKAGEEFSIALSILLKINKENEPLVIPLPHCMTVRELTVDRVLHEINMLKIDFLLEKVFDRVLEEELYFKCMSILAPLLFCTTDVHIDFMSYTSNKETGKGSTSVELRALDILIKACKNEKPADMDVLLKCHHRKLKVLMVAAGMDFPWSNKGFDNIKESGPVTASESELKENSSSGLKEMVSEEIRVIQQLALVIKSDDTVISTSSIRDIQTLLLAAMCYYVSSFSSKKSSSSLPFAQTEEKKSCSFVGAAIAFCKFQHLDRAVHIQPQIDLIVALHTLLADYGLCCAGDSSDGEEGTFLKFAVKHLLYLDVKLKSVLHTAIDDETQCNLPHLECNQEPHYEITEEEMVCLETALEKDIFGEVATDCVPTLEKEIPEGIVQEGSQRDGNPDGGEDLLMAYLNELTEDEREDIELKIDNALDQCFFCLYGLSLRSDSGGEDELATHKNSSNGEYQTKEHCADVFQYILPSARASSRTRLVKLRRVLRAIRKQFPHPPECVLVDNVIDKFLDDPDLCEDSLSEESGSEGFLKRIINMIYSHSGGLRQYKKSVLGRSEPYADVYSNLYFFLAQSEEMNATDKWPGFVLTKEGEEFVQQSSTLFKYDLVYNPLRFESWQKLAHIYDEEVDLLLNDGSKHINAMGWRKNASLAQRVETSRRRSRRCLLVSLALAKTSVQQSDTHEWLALVYYDSLQNVVPFYDQRFVLPNKDATWIKFCQNSLGHFKKAFAKREDWSHAFYMGKLCEKLGYAPEMSFTYYEQAIALNFSAVDPVYRMHASRLKLLWKCGKQSLEMLKVVASFCFSQATKDVACEILCKVSPGVLHPLPIIKEVSFQTTHTSSKKNEDMCRLEEVWGMLYNDCLIALEGCIGGDLKHFHKARYMLAQGYYKRGQSGDLEKAKDELSFCFRSSRSAFTINMWEIDGMVKKGRRKTPGVAVSKKGLEVNLSESSRKFITCIRKYLLLYLKLLEELKDVSILEKAFISVKSDKRFLLSIEDLVPLALGRHIKALIASMPRPESITSGSASNPDIKEKLFSMFTEHGLLWPDVSNLPEMKGPDFSETSLYGYLHQYLHSLENIGKLETFESVNEKLRKRFKNLKGVNPNCVKVCKHSSVAWGRCIVYSLAMITPMEAGLLPEDQDLNQPAGGSQLLCVDLRSNEFWASPYEETAQLKEMETKWGPLLLKLKNTIIKKASESNLETASDLLRYSYNFYRESIFTSTTPAVNLYLVPHKLLLQKESKSSSEGVEILDVTVQRKLLLWAYTLFRGHCTSISGAVKYCEDNLKPKTKKGGAGVVSALPTTLLVSGGGKEGPPCAGSESGPVPESLTVAAEEKVLTPVVVAENDRDKDDPAARESPTKLKQGFAVTVPALVHCSNSGEKITSSKAADEGHND
ncbi:hypothetical protein MLD38_014066 [Melastoma candidum]|uniref:Uncharacterized protein n=1 Tax=Melastoma candidum TaxID=119954 RepID=A0ACB9RBJ0_9MYRT|nr:hypothetical protein MLD38_014066 [Melastoma candidum]